MQCHLQKYLREFANVEKDKKKSVVWLVREKKNKVELGESGAVSLLRSAEQQVLPEIM